MNVTLMEFKSRHRMDRGFRVSQNMRTLINLPDPAGPTSTVSLLPAGILSESAAWCARMHFAVVDGRIMFDLTQADGGTLVRHHQLIESQLWQRVTWSDWNDPDEMWWLAWRCPDAAHDLLTAVDAGLREIEGLVEDPFMVAQTVRRLRDDLNNARFDPS